MGVHKDTFADSATRGPPSIYGAEGPVGRSFIHESGHGIFGLADEYDDGDCSTGYFQPNPMPNIWATEALGRSDATTAGWNPDDIWKFTECPDDWWKLGPTEYIMSDGSMFPNGWGVAAQRRIQWLLDQFPACAGGGQASLWKAIWLKVQVIADVFGLLDESFIVDSPPNYLLGKLAFTVRVFSIGGALLGEYGISDPRRVLAEPDYQGPTWLDNTTFD